MCQEIDDHFLLEVLENGGFRVLKTPLTDEMVMQARQDVLRERVHKSKQFTLLDECETLENESFQDSEQDDSSIKNNVKSVGVKKKKYTRWTKENHSKFLRAIHELGEGSVNSLQTCLLSSI